ncbi:membrane protein [soil metagenome]
MPTALARHARTILFNRVPEATFAFWVITVLSSTTGAVMARLLVNNALGFDATLLVSVGLLAVALAAQFGSRRYTVGVYWPVVVLIGIIGAELAHTPAGRFGMPPWVGVLLAGAALAGTLALWSARERTLSVDTVFTRRREAFYWIAALFAGALGSAAGAVVTGFFALGPLASTVVFTALVGVVVIIRFLFQVNAAICFWVAYVLTRPLGTALGDLVSRPARHGGLGLGATATSLLVLAVIAATVTYLAVRVSRQRTMSLAA